MAAIRSKVEKLNQSREQGTLHHHQCIDELTSHLRNTEIKCNVVDEMKPVSPTRSETPTSFVTVIEVKDPSPIPATIATSQISTSISIAANDGADFKPEPTIPAPILQQHESKEEVEPVVVETNEERNTSPVQNVEIRRKIPPRYVCDNTRTFIERQKKAVFDKFNFQTTAKSCATYWTDC